ncbi:MAG: RHS repeat-associated core domain-containing protein [Bacteroidales bacterium]|jgi:RHS repeat-associated protein
MINFFGNTAPEFAPRAALSLKYYGARFFESAIGRWHTPDPSAESYASQSPYNYGVIIPVNFVDPTGMYRTANRGYMDKTYGERNYWYRDNPPGTWGGG